MTDNTGRSIDYLRISLTDRCDLRCIYCIPESGVCAMEHAQILSFEEILRIVGIMTGLGLKHIRLTGGEPMVRRGCLELAERLHALEGVESISMTSNGILLKDRVHRARLSGISSLNISLDALNPSVYSRLTRGGDVSRVLCTLQQALEEGLNVKVNAVPVRGFNEAELIPIARLARRDALCVRFIELMPIGYGAQAERIPYGEVAKMLKEAGIKSKIILQVHDELVLEAPIEEKEEASRILSEAMKGAADLAVSLEIGLETGNNWLEAH